MKMISFHRVLNTSFKQFQLLPVLSSGAGSMPAATPRPQVNWRVRKAVVARPCQDTPTTSTRLPMPSSKISPADRWLMTLLALNAVVCLVQAFAAVGDWSRQWVGFEQWVARLLS